MRKLLFTGVGVAALVSTACATTTAQEARVMTQQPAAATATAQNPLLAKWSGKYGGVPPFDQIKVEHFKPALEASIEENRRDIAAILRAMAVGLRDSDVRRSPESRRPSDRLSSPLC